MRAAGALVVVTLAAGCPAGGDDACFIGDPAAPVELVVLLRQADGTMAEATAGAAAPLIKPPQGGKVIFVGARARNLDGCGAQVTSALYDECAGDVVGNVDSRPVTLVEGADGWGAPRDPVQISNWANVPACPDAQAARDVEGERYLLRLVVTDRDGRTAEAAVEVVPTCAEAEYETECRCECDGDYVLGQACAPEPDGGPPAGCQ